MLDDITIDDNVRELRPDYRALLITAHGLTPGPSDDFSERRLSEAEETARKADDQDPPHVVAWRDTYKAFGAKPQRTQPSVDALLRRLDEGLPRVDRLTDIYNAVSIAHVVPVGGEDLDHYKGAARLVRADGSEEFVTSTVEHPRPGEVVWRDDAGVTCRRWNWRQCHRTRITHDTTNALFILDALGAMSDEQLDAAGAALIKALEMSSPGVRISTRTV